MGGCLGRPDANAGAGNKYKVDAKDGEQASKPSGGISNGPYQRPKLDPKDYTFKDLKGGVHVKEGIKGQAFTIDNCEDCDLYIIDHLGQVTIDQCKNCRIFLGPTDGSVFIRDCSDCKLAVLCRQLRALNCTGCDLLVHCRTRPSIESSSKMRFGCYNFNYKALPGQLQAAKLSVLHNFWSNIYDFTAHSGNWGYLPADTTVPSLLGKGPNNELPAEATAVFGEGAGGEGPLIVTFGDRSPQPSPDYLFCVFPDRKLDAAMQFANQAKHTEVLLHSNRAVVPPDVAAEMTKLAGWSRGVEHDLCTGQPIGFEVSGVGCVTKLRGVAHALGGHYTEVDTVGAAFRLLGLEGSG